MKWQRWLLAAVLVSGVTAVGCGEDEDPVELNEEQNQQDQNQNQNQNNDEDDEFAEGVDVWVGDETGNAEVPTHVEVGETFGGRFGFAGSHHFSIDLDAGDVLTVSSVDFESDLEADLDSVAIDVVPHIDDGGMFQLGGPAPRTFLPSAHDAREFFVPTTDTYILEVQAPGDADEELGFVFETGVDNLEGQDGFELPGTTEGGDLDDGQLDAYDVSHGELVSADVEVFANRPPVMSDLNAWMYVWNETSGELVAQSSGQTEENPDPLATVDFEESADYQVIIDATENVTDAAYEIETELRDTSETNRFELSLEGDDSFSGLIQERTSAPFFDYFEVTVEPGEYKKVTVEGHDALEPILQIDDADAEDGGLFGGGGPAVNALAVGNEAGATLGVAEGAESAVTMTIDVTDQRSLTEEDVSPFYGGDDFDYTISLHESDAAASLVDTDEPITVDLDSPGELELFDVDTDEDHLLWLDSGVEDDIDEDDDVLDFDFLPGWAFADGDTLATTNPYTAAYWGDGEVENFMLRDEFFRGDATGYSTDIEFRSFDAESPDYQEQDLKVGNESVGDAADLSLPALITGEYEEPEDDGTRMQQQEEPDPETHYFEFGVETGDTVVVHTLNDPINESNLSILDDGDEVATSSLYLEQRQVAGEDEEYYDGAMVYDAEADQDLVLQIEQFCGQGLMGPFCDYGEIGVHVFVD